MAENKTNIKYLFNNKFWRENTNKVPEIKEKNKKCIIPTPIKCSGNKTRGGVSEGSNKQSTQSNEDEENPGEHLQNVSSFESNNNSSSHNESEEKEKEKKIEEEINNAIKKMKEQKEKTVTKEYFFAGQKFEEKKEINEKENRRRKKRRRKYYY